MLNRGCASDHATSALSPGVERGTTGRALRQGRHWNARRAGSSHRRWNRSVRHIPGLVDLHTHVSKTQASSLGLLVAHGVTTVRDLGVDHEDLLRWKEQVTGDK